jgi:hypothetical protein
MENIFLDANWQHRYLSNVHFRFKRRCIGAGFNSWVGAHSACSRIDTGRRHNGRDEQD